MQYVIIAADGTDPQAPTRRTAARPAHTARGNDLLAAGNLLFRAALTDEQGVMNGSLYVVDFPTRSDLQTWLESEPYVLGDVWRDIDIRPAAVPRPS